MNDFIFYIKQFTGLLGQIIFQFRLCRIDTLKYMPQSKHLFVERQAPPVYYKPIPKNDFH
jgi:hypothetical protein